MTPNTFVFTYNKKHCYKTIDYSRNILPLKYLISYTIPPFFKPRQKDRINQIYLGENLADLWSKLHKRATFNLYFYLILL